MSGVQHWRLTRYSSIAMIPLLLWMVWFATGMIGLDYMAATEKINQPLNLILLFSFVVISSWHALLGLEMVITDYVHDSSASKWVLRLCQLGLMLLVLTVVYCLLTLVRAG